jgi:hypothetical protein
MIVESVQVWVPADPSAPADSEERGETAGVLFQGLDTEQLQTRVGTTGVHLR